jgi:hypothetical protein
MWPPADQWFGVWGLLVIVAISIATSQVLAFFTQLTGMRWIWCYSVGIAVAAFGVSMIFYSKLPIYRERRFFTFGARALPEQRRPAYRWGYRCAIFAIVLFACLFLSRH